MSQERGQRISSHGLGHMYGRTRVDSVWPACVSGRRGWSVVVVHQWEGSHARRTMEYVARDGVLARVCVRHSSLATGQWQLTLAGAS